MLLCFSHVKNISFRTFTPTQISGNDFGTVENFPHRLTFSPNQMHSIFVNSVGNGEYLIANNSNIAFQFSVSRGNRIMANIDYKSSSMVINNQWEIKEKFLYNHPLTVSPDIRRSPALNFEIGADRLGRIDIKFDGMNYVTLMFNDRELFVVSFDGDEIFDEFGTFVAQECNRKPLTVNRVNNYLNNNPGVKLEFIRDYMEDWLVSYRNETDNADASAGGMIQRFIDELELNNN